MMIWTPFRPQNAALSPYIDWLNGRGERAAQSEVLRALARLLPLLNSQLGLPLREGGGRPDPMGMGKFVAEVEGQNGKPGLVGKLANLPDLSGEPPLDPDTVIMGVIDADIALGHRRFRDAGGASRVIYSWQMGAQGQPNGGLPLGRERLGSEINRKLAESSGSDPTGRLDSDAFNLDLDLTQMTGLNGSRALAGRFAHGTFVTDLAAGCDALADPEFARRVRIIAINLPHRVSFGSSGEYLNLYMMVALQRVVDIAAHFWRQNHKGATLAGGTGYPTVINLSYGRQAGAKNPKVDLFERVVADLIADSTGHARLDIVMPAGNDNLARVNAVQDLAPGQGLALDWRIPPGDLSDNFIEMWADTDPTGKGKPSGSPALTIALTPPGGVAQPLTLTPGAAWQLGQIARIYSHDAAMPPDGAPGVAGALFCMAPTLDRSGAPVAPPGDWAISVHNTGAAPVRVRLSIQSDQGVLPSSHDHRRSALIAEDYRRHDEMGRLVDTFTWQDGVWSDTDTARALRRRGTINASSVGEDVVCIAGHRASDGMPAPYSASGFGEPLPVRGAPTVSLPSDDGVAHVGILASGAQDGSVVAARGTSFASAQAARLVVAARLAGNLTDRGNGILTAMADDQKAAGPAFPVPRVQLPPEEVGGVPTVTKLGHGRIRPPPRPLPRMGRR